MSAVPPPAHPSGLPLSPQSPAPGGWRQDPAAIVGMSAELPPRRMVAAVIHDVAPPTWRDCQRLVEALERLGLAPLSLLAVPRYHGAARSPAFERWLVQRAQAGDEVLLHGYEHRDPSPLRGPWQRLQRRVYTRGEGEFAALTRWEAQTRLQAGRAWLDALGLRPAGFVAPAWLLSRGSWQALVDQPFLYTCTLRQVVLLPQGPTLRCQAQVWSTRSRWRRTASAWWNAALLHAQATHPLLRLELHPGDARHGGTLQSWRRVAETALAQQRQPVVLAAVAQLLAHCSLRPLPLDPLP